MLDSVLNRRHFIGSMLATGSTLCFASPRLFAADQQEDKNRFEVKSDMSFREVYQNGIVDRVNRCLRVYRRVYQEGWAMETYVRSEIQH